MTRNFDTSTTDFRNHLQFLSAESTLAQYHSRKLLPLLKNSLDEELARGSSVETENGPAISVFQAFQSGDEDVQMMHPSEESPIHSSLAFFPFPSRVPPMLGSVAHSEWVDRLLRLRNWARRILAKTETSKAAQAVKHCEGRCSVGKVSEEESYFIIS